MLCVIIALALGSGCNSHSWQNKSFQSTNIVNTIMTSEKWFGEVILLWPHLVLCGESETNLLSKFEYRNRSQQLQHTSLLSIGNGIYFVLKNGIKNLFPMNRNRSMHSFSCISNLNRVQNMYYPMTHYRNRKNFFLCGFCGTHALYLVSLSSENEGENRPTLKCNENNWINLQNSKKFWIFFVLFLILCHAQFDNTKLRYPTISTE